MTVILTLTVTGALTLGCSPRTLILVEPCRDGAATCPRSLDATSPDDASDARADSDGATTLRNGLVGLWHFDDGAGSPIATDSSGNRNHGTLTRLDASSAWVTGRIQNGLHTNGGGFASVLPSSSIDGIVNQVTVAAWVYLEGTIVDYATAASRQIGNTYTQHYHIALNAAGRPSLFINRGVPADFLVQVIAPVAVAPLTWTHIAGTYDGATATLYVDGTEVGSRPIFGALGPETNPLILGGNGNAQIVDECFPGRIDEIVLYDRALSPEEIRQLASGAVL